MWRKQKMSNPLLSTETEYIIDAGNIHCKITVDDLTDTVVNGGFCLKKFNGVKFDILKKWLYERVSRQYKITRQMKLTEKG
jgi:hypothetical protein